MKLILGKHCYLQKFDIAFLLHNSVIIPTSFRDEVLQWQDNLRIRSTRDHFTFIGPFVKPETIEWVNTQSCVIDYNECAQQPIKALNKRIRKQIKETKLYTNSIHVMRHNCLDSAVEDHLRATKRQMRKVEQEIASLEIMRDHMEGKIDFDFPEDYTPPTPPVSQKAKLFDRFLSHYSIP